MTQYQDESLDLLLSRLGSVKRHGERYMAKCPAHKDKNPSLSLSRGDDRRALIHCHAGCETHDVLAAIGLEMRDLFSENLSQEQHQQYRRRKLEAERKFEHLVIEAAKVEATEGDLSDENITRLALAHERVTQLDRQLADLDSQPEPYRPALLEVALSDVMSATPEPVRHAVNPWMPRRHVTLLGGHGGIGKSSLALAIAAHVACGLSFSGLEVEQSPVLFVSLEDEASIVRLRLRRIIEAYQLPAAQVLAGLRLLDGTQSFTALMTDGDGVNSAPNFTTAFRELSSHAVGAGLIIIDNASDAFDANENSRRSVRAFVRGLASIARQNNAALVLLAHIDKASAKAGANGNSYSGSTAWHNSARSRLALLEQDGQIQLVHEKANLSARAEPVSIVFVDGVPMPEAGTQGDCVATASFDQAAITRALKAAHDAGIKIPASTSHGAYSAMKMLQSFPEYTKVFRGKVGNQRAASAITELIRTGQIRRCEYKTANRKSREHLVLSELPSLTTGSLEKMAHLNAQSAPLHPPITPQHIGAAHVDACASAPNTNGAIPNTTGASGAEGTAQSSALAELQTLEHP